MYEMKRIFLVLITLIVFSCYGSAVEKRALLIGISNYPDNNSSANSWNSIHGSNDVDILNNTLQEQNFKVDILTNENAIANKIRTAFKKIIRDCKKGDIVYVHFSGHGQPVEDLNGDEEDGWDEAIVPYDAEKTFIKGKYEGKNHILDDELNILLNEIRKKVGSRGYVAVVIDACHAGSAYRGDEEVDSIVIRGTNSGFSETNKPFVPKIDKRSKIKIESSPNMSPICLVEACRSYQVNCEIKENGIYYGPLSFYLNEIIRNTQFNRNNLWAEKINEMMSKDRRLIKQNVVIEISH